MNIDDLSKMEGAIILGAIPSVWAVMEANPEGQSTIYGVFSTKENAQKYIDENKERLYLDYEYIEEYKLDEGL